MQVELTKRDLIRLVTSVEPSLNESNKYNKYGELNGGHDPEWRWNKTSLYKLTEQELYNLFIECKQHLDEHDDYMNKISTNCNNCTNIRKTDKHNCICLITQRTISSSINGDNTIYTNCCDKFNRKYYY